VATVVPRLGHLLGGDWQKTTVELPDGQWKNWLTGSFCTGGKVAVGELLEDFPVALLVRERRRKATANDTGATSDA